MTNLPLSELLCKLGKGQILAFEIYPWWLAENPMEAYMLRQDRLPGLEHGPTLPMPAGKKSIKVQFDAADNPADIAGSYSFTLPQQEVQLIVQVRYVSNGPWQVLMSNIFKGATLIAGPQGIVLPFMATNIPASPYPIEFRLGYDLSGAARFALNYEFSDNPL